MYREVRARCNVNETTILESFMNTKGKNFNMGVEWYLKKYGHELKGGWTRHVRSSEETKNMRRKEGRLPSVHELHGNRPNGWKRKKSNNTL